MNKELPKMYHNNILKEIKNNCSIYSSLNNKNNNNIEYDRYTIENKIYNIFNSSNYIYKADVTIVLDNDIVDKRIIGKNNNYLITMDNEYIPISSIKDIYRK